MKFLRLLLIGMTMLLFPSCATILGTEIVTKPPHGALIVREKFVDREPGVLTPQYEFGPGVYKAVREYPKFFLYRSDESPRVKISEFKGSVTTTWDGGFYVPKVNSRKLRAVYLRGEIYAGGNVIPAEVVSKYVAFRN